MVLREKGWKVGPSDRTVQTLGRGAGRCPQMGPEVILPAGYGQEFGQCLRSPAEEIVEGKLIWNTRSSLRRCAIKLCSQFRKGNPLWVFRSVVNTTVSCVNCNELLPSITSPLNS